MKHRRERVGGFTLIEVLVVLAVLAGLAAILLPSFAQARERGRQAACLSNLRQWGQALAMYREDQGSYPPFAQHTQALQPYVKDRRLFFCPDHRDPPGITMLSSYRYEMSGDRLRHGRQPLGPRSVIVYCGEHQTLGDAVWRLTRLPRAGIYSGVFPVLRQDGSAELLPAARVSVRLQPMPRGEPWFGGSAMVLEFPE
jgi:prepilin-type N-terminal cleavage/methylation domain-containing protein